MSVDGWAVLRDRNVFLVWCANVVSAIGTGAMFVALPTHTFIATGSIASAALVTLAELAPAVGVAQVAGVVVDRLDAKRILICANLALAACTMALLLHDSWWWLAVVAFVRSCVAQFSSPAANVLLPSVAPPGRLLEVNGVGAVGGNLARLAGPALGGILLGASGLDLVVVVDVASLVAAAGLFVGVRPRNVPREVATSGFFGQWRHGWRTVRRHHVLGPMIVVMALTGFGEGFVSALIAPWMLTVVGGTPAELGLMLSLQAVGGLIGASLVVHAGQRWDSRTLLAGAALASGVLLLATFNYPLALAAGPWLAITLTALCGIPFATYSTAQAVTIQTHSPDGYRGRATTLTYGPQRIAQLAGVAIAGPVGTWIGPLAINVDAVAYIGAAIMALMLLRARPNRPDRDDAMS